MTPTHPNLRRLTYRSTRASGLTDEALLRELILPARARNHRHGITGCLWCGAHTFVHIIEGEDAVVDTLMKHLTTDPRHTNVTVLSQQRAEIRLFKDWNLKWVRGTDCQHVEALANAAAQHTPPNATVESELGITRGNLPGIPSDGALLLIRELANAAPTLY